MAKCDTITKDNNNNTLKEQNKMNKIISTVKMALPTLAVLAAVKRFLPNLGRYL